jgi:hypothetical protein
MTQPLPGTEESVLQAPGGADDTLDLEGGDQDFTTEFQRIFQAGNANEFVSGVQVAADDDVPSLSGSRNEFYRILDALDGHTTRYEFFGFNLTVAQIEKVMDNVRHDLETEEAAARARGDNAGVAQAQEMQRDLETYETIQRSQGSAAAQQYLNTRPALRARMQQEAQQVATSSPQALAPAEISNGEVAAGRVLTIEEERARLRGNHFVLLSEEERRQIALGARRAWDTACQTSQDCYDEASRRYTEYRPIVDRFVADRVEDARPVVERAGREAERAAEAGAATLREAARRTFTPTREERAEDEARLNRTFDTVATTTRQVVDVTRSAVDNTVAAVRRIDWNPFD